MPGTEPGPAVTANGPGPVQGRPVNEFLPNGGVSIVVLGAGETGTGGVGSVRQGHYPIALN